MSKIREFVWVFKSKMAAVLPQHYLNCKYVFRMDVETKMLMHVTDSYWDLLPLEVCKLILLMKRTQEQIDEEKKRVMEKLGEEIVMYKKLKDKWALGHVKCVVKKQVFFSTYIVIMGCYFDREDCAERERFLGFDFRGAMQRINHVKSFM